MESDTELLKAYLLDGPKPYDEVKSHFAELGISRFRLKRAREELGTKTINTGDTWLWCLPGEEPTWKNQN